MGKNLRWFKNTIEIRGILQMLPSAYMEKPSIGIIFHKIINLCGHIPVTDIHFTVIRDNFDTLLKIESCCSLFLITVWPLCQR